MKTVEFSFDRTKLDGSGYTDLYKLRDFYKTVLERYFKEIFDLNIKVDLDFKNLNKEEGETSIFSDNNRYNKFSQIMSYTANMEVRCMNSKDGSFIFRFYMYNQNNCCGAMTVSDTVIYYRYLNHKLAKLLQYLKEDIAINQSVSLLTCTDTFYKNYKEAVDGKIEDLVPYLQNTKVLLSSGWVVDRLFYNRRSNNVVALYTKEIPTVNDRINKIDMKITKIKDKLIEVKNVTVGCDPELFFRSKETNQFVPSFYVMGGDKYNPVAITEDGHGISCDNVMAEYMVPPSKTAKEFVEHNLLVQDYLKEKIAEPNNLELVIFPFAEFNANDLLDDKAKTFGCSPDFSVYNEGRPNKVGRPLPTGRSAGGHIHIGYDDSNMLTNNYIIKALDLFISVPLVIMEPNNRRKEMYGSAGSYRVTSYGIEYRSPSNYIFSSPELMEWAFNQVQAAIKFLNSGGSGNLNDDSATIRICIDNKNVGYAEYLINKHNINIIKTKAVA